MKDARYDEAKHIAVIGGGPAGLMAAETLSAEGYAVTVYEAMPTVGRKFLLAGKSGLNITHSEDYARFVERFGAASSVLRPALDQFTPEDIRAWAGGLGVTTFIGSSGRIFPVEMKASPLLRAWRRRLEAQGVRILTRHRWVGFSGDDLIIDTPAGRLTVSPRATLLALGGASWPRLGSDGSWLPWLKELDVDVAEFRPANCGFVRTWSDHFRDRFAGAPVKAVVAQCDGHQIPGEFVISKTGIEGSLVYAHSALLRDEIETRGQAVLELDLAPGRSSERLMRDLGKADRKQSLSNRIRKATGLDAVKIALLREIGGDLSSLNPSALASLIKALPLKLDRPRPIEEAISSAGGIRFSEIDADFGLKDWPGLFVAGEMMDWEAPTGGYLLTACLATGRAAGRGIAAYLTR